MRNDTKQEILSKNEFRKIFLERPDWIYNSYYRTYKAIFVKTTGLPIFNTNTFKEKDRRFLSKTNCKKIKKPIKADELPVAWYRGMHGFYPLFFREWEDTLENRKKLGYNLWNLNINTICKE